MIENVKNLLWWLGTGHYHVANCGKYCLYHGENGGGYDEIPEKVLEEASKKGYFTKTKNGKSWDYHITYEGTKAAVKEYYVL